MAFDSGALLFSYIAFTLVRYEGGATGEILRNVTVLALLAVLVQCLAGTVIRIYQGRATVASLEETIFLSFVTVGSGMVVEIVNLLADSIRVARSVPFAATFMALFVMVLGRAAWRTHLQSRGLAAAAEAAPTIVFGAGDAGRQLVRSMLSSPAADMRPVGLLDDDRWKRNLRVHGISVLGNRHDIRDVARSTGAQNLVIAVPSADAALIRDVSHAAREAGLSVKLLPAVHELLDHKVSIRDIRDINVHDLLGRVAVETDINAIAGYVTGKRVLVTGAGGSIGSELCRQLHKFGPAELIMLDRDESALHGVQLSLHGNALLDSPEVVLADIRDRAALDRVFLYRRPEVVFHAAALKHLPMLEQYPAEAVKTNVIGTVNVLQASVLVGVERFVNISTDKAADPTSVLGYSKRVAERLTSAVAADAGGCYLSVRFGNVLGSRGSVLTTFTSQIATGGPLTVTHPEVTRYFMTVEEAVQLVIQAAAIGSDGEALILDMGEPVRIVDVAQQLIDQSGHDIEIVFTGLRDGEKLHEHLYGDSELGERRVHPLVSHVSVPGLPPSQVQAGSLRCDDDALLKQLVGWCELEEGSLAEELEILPRRWSAVES
jgi:FlaA1/EpsC-like NDP-sugar epimerase